MRAVLALLLLCAGCALGADLNQFCPVVIKTNDGTEYTVECPGVRRPDAGVDVSVGDEPDTSMQGLDAGVESSSDVREAAVIDAAIIDAAVERARDAAPDVRDAPADRGADVRDAALDPVREETTPPARDASADAGRPVLLGLNDIGFWRGSVDRAALRASMVAMGVRAVRIPFASFAADAPGTIDTPAWRAQLVDAYLAVGITPIPVAFGARSGVEATCNISTDALNAVVDDWTGADAPWLKSRNVVLNIANEWGPSDPAGGAADPGLVVWRDAYVAAIGRIRGAGITVPLLIDAPACGQNAYAVERFGAAVAAADPLGQVIFSIHTYPSFWTTGAAESWQLALVQHFDALRATGLSIVIGEFSSSEFGATVGPGALDPAVVIAQAQAHGFGWLAWQAFNDSAESILNLPAAYPPASSLTPFGRVVVQALLGRTP